MVFKDGTNEILQMTSAVKGNWGAGSYKQGDYVLHDGIWHQVTNATGATSTQSPYNPNNLEVYGTDIANGYSHGDALITAAGAGAGNNLVVVASSVMQGGFNGHQDYAAGDVVYNNGVFYEFDANSASTLSQNWASQVYHGDIVRYNGEYYEALNPRAIGDDRLDATN